MALAQVIRCSECAAPVETGQVRCNYCGYWFVKSTDDIRSELQRWASNVAYQIAMHSYLRIGEIARQFGEDLFK